MKPPLSARTGVTHERGIERADQEAGQRQQVGGADRGGSLATAPAMIASTR